MKKIVFFIMFNVLISSLSANVFYTGIKLDFNTGIPFQANGTVGGMIRNKVTKYFYFDNVFDAGYTMTLSSFIYDQGMIFSHTLYPTFRFGKKNVFFTFSTPSPVFKIIPYVHRYFRMDNEYYTYEITSDEIFDQFYFGVSNRISLEIEFNDTVTFSPIALNADFLMNIISTFSNRYYSFPSKFMGGLGSYILIKIK